MNCPSFLQQVMIIIRLVEWGSSRKRWNGDMALVLAGANGIKENCLKSGAGNASDHSELQVCLLFLHKTTQGNAMDPAVDHLLIFNVFGVSLIMIQRLLRMGSK
ncbi:hypothetical protein Tco_0701254 [Tanacetum coccineum]